MKKYFTVLALVVLSSHGNAATCGELSYEELISSTQRGTVAKAIECPKEKEVVASQLPGPVECRRITLNAFVSLQKNQNKDAAVQTLRDISQNFNCTDDVLENARQALQKVAFENLKSAVRAFSGR